jgi:hypothetical protein
MLFSTYYCYDEIKENELDLACNITRKRREISTEKFWKQLHIFTNCKMFVHVPGFTFVTSSANPVQLVSPLREV